ncbi:CoA-acylating methylmalonate-semialdehyde dehydrogenase [Luteolibacter pohnpeiensis]|uniref:methylmalonate-semialdehyde dehydrogenase (CoA acylating) n=1 Tax=Luteolibacter pohnpeiensis TaxID=454153 RepID=A0A934VTF6_9BACT|nr:CoA-acylating methylmalonate-semialdehyde dehydrogenase [Luteolibacter pohnpeiensis]MBK1881437.1 CoA-acylating methylmalonate-semialdehyde dehydrogenase [Luteolibacter pohnpeiensis]
MSSTPDNCLIYLDGKWKELGYLPTSPVYNPSRGSILAHVPLCGPAEVNLVVDSAKRAFPNWRDTPPNERAQVLFRLKILLEDAFEELCLGIATEHGKTLSEARGDLRRGIEVVEFACGIPTLLMGESLENIARGIDCHTDRHPLGVVAGICPFNFPALVPMWMWPIAIACGNTFVLKPSEKVPLTMQRVVGLLEKAGLPPGVMNIVHGGRECVDALLEHPDVAAISFVGSTPVAREIHRKATSFGKRVQAAGGAKNFIVLMPDADVERTAEAVKDGAFGCAGERCMAGSTAIAVGDAGSKLLPALADLVKSMKVGPTDSNDRQPDMGAVISASHRDHVTGLIHRGEQAGAKVLADGRSPLIEEAPDGFFLGPTLIDQVEYGNPLMDTEVFGPVLAVMRASSLDDAIALANRQSYGNGAAIFTNSGKAAREFRRQVSAGMIGINVAVPAPLAYFPFSGWNDSFFGDLHIQGKEGVEFYTQRKTTTTRWFGYGDGEIWAK